MPNPIVYFDVTIGGAAAGRIVFTLFAGNFVVFSSLLMPLKRLHSVT